MADELVGRIVESHRYSGVKTDLSHQDEERKDGIAVIGEHLVEVPGEEVHCRGKAIEIAESHKTDEGHGKPQFDPRREQQEQDADTCQTDQRLMHGHSLQILAIS